MIALEFIGYLAACLLIPFFMCWIRDLNAPRRLAGLWRAYEAEQKRAA